MFGAEEFCFSTVCFLKNSICRMNDLNTSESKEPVSLNKLALDILERESEPFINKIKCGYDFSKSTEQMYGAESDVGSTDSRYANIRQTLDYSYHSHYSQERMRLQDAIVDYFLTATLRAMDREDVVFCRGPFAKPWIVFTAGAMGAGKSHMLKWLDQQNYFPYRRFVRVDPDEIRQLLPELRFYRENEMSTAGTKTHKEAGFIVEILTMASLLDGRNVVVDGSLQDKDWYAFYFRKLKEVSPQHQIAIIHVTAPWEQVNARAARRASKTGRVIPLDTLLRTFQQVPDSVRALSALADVDYTVEINNSEEQGEPTLITQGESWANFRLRWRTFCSEGKDAEEYMEMIDSGDHISTAKLHCDHSTKTSFTYQAEQDLLSMEECNKDFCRVPRLPSVTHCILKTEGEAVIVVKRRSSEPQEPYFIPSFNQSHSYCLVGDHDV